MMDSNFGMSAYRKFSRRAKPMLLLLLPIFMELLRVRLGFSRVNF